MTTRALVVGINAYAPPNALPSCVQDAQSFNQLLATKYRFGEIKTLTDDQATKAGVLSGLQWLFAQAAPGDQLVFFYSGHGYQPVIDNELREALVTQDSQFIDDTELAAAMASVPNGVLSIVLDTCFSGGLEKVFVNDQGAISHVAKSKYWTPASAAPAAAAVQDKSQAKTFRPFGTLTPTASKGFVPAGTDATVTSLQLPASKGLLMSAAQADETASASTPSTKGLSAFTYALLDAVAANVAETAAIALMRAAGATLHQMGLRQTPAIKQPIAPPGMGDWSFLTLQPPQLSPAGNVAGPFASQPQENFMTSPHFALGAPSTSAPWGAMPDKGWIDTISSIVSTVVPVVVPIVARGLQSKGFVAQAPVSMTAPLALGNADKGWLDSITSIVNTVVPVVVPVVAQALQSKGFTPHPAFAPSASLGAGSLADKGWLESITSIVNTVVPAVVPVVAQALQSKGFVPQAPTAAPGGIALPSLDDKSWVDVVTRVASTVAPIALALL